MTTKRSHWLTKAIESLHDAYDYLGEATSLVPPNEDFDATIDQHQQLLDDLTQQLEALRDKQT